MLSRLTSPPSDWGWGCGWTFDKPRYMRLHFLPLGCDAYPLLTCFSSPSPIFDQFNPPVCPYTLTCYGRRQANYSSPCCEAMAKMLSGRYRSWWLWRHWTHKSGKGDVANLLSCECPALQSYLAIAFQCIWVMLNPTPSSSTSFSQSCMQTGRRWLHSSVLDPSRDFVIRFVQLYGEVAIQF